MAKFPMLVYVRQKAWIPEGRAKEESQAVSGIKEKACCHCTIFLHFLVRRQSFFAAWLIAAK